MNIERLVYGRQGAIEAYGYFDRRCREFVNTHAPNAASVPIDAIMREMLGRWVGQPDLAGYFVALGDGPIPIGHIASWIVNYYGQPRLFIWQVEIDQSFPKTVLMGVNAIKDWISGLNVQLPLGQNIELVELSTWHDPKVFIRYLRIANLEPLLTTSTIQFKL